MIKGSIYLSGGGDEQQSLALDRFFFAEIPEAGRLLYVPIALRTSEKFKTAESWMRQVLTLHKREGISLKTIYDFKEELGQELKQFDAIYIGGGNTWSLMKEIKESKFGLQLQAFLENGGVVYGGSAGAIALGRRIDTQEDINEVGLQDVGGLALLDDYSIACHYTDAEYSHYSDWANKAKSPLICLGEDAGVIFKSDKVVYINEKSTKVFSS